MDASQKNYKGQVEINDLINDAVKDAVSRRNKVMDSENVLSVLSDEEAGSIAGGITTRSTQIGVVAYDPPIICGEFPSQNPMNLSH